MGCQPATSMRSPHQPSQSKQGNSPLFFPESWVPTDLSLRLPEKHINARPEVLHHSIIKCAEYHYVIALAMQRKGKISPSREALITIEKTYKTAWPVLTQRFKKQNKRTSMETVNSEDANADLAGDMFKMPLMMSRIP